MLMTKPNYRNCKSNFKRWQNTLSNWNTLKYFFFGLRYCLNLKLFVASLPGVNKFTIWNERILILSNWHMLTIRHIVIDMNLKDAIAHMSVHVSAGSISVNLLTLVRWHWDLCFVWQVLHDNPSEKQCRIKWTRLICHKTILTEEYSDAHRIGRLCTFTRWCTVYTVHWSMNYGTAFESYINYLIMDWWYVCLFILLYNYVALTAC